jgi:hypothetical protein
MENTAAATDPSFDAVDVAVTGSIAATAPTASTDTTAKDKAKVKVKKELTTAEREVENQKWQARRVAHQTRKAEAMNAALEEERRERLTIVAGATSSSSVTSQALCRPMLPHSPATPRASTPVPSQAHASSRFGDT